jgi:DNA-binding beta-propeller fold protein YncE
VARAEDGFSTQTDLEYRVVRSLLDNIGTLETAMANGTVAVDWTRDLGACDVTGLVVLTQYFMNVLVRDRAGNVAAYTGASATTTNDTTAPTPGPPTSLTIDNSTMDHFHVSWTKGTDDISLSSTLTYQVYYSKTTNLGSLTAAQVIASGTAYGSPAVDIATIDLTTGMDDNVLYYVNVVVRDENSNAAAYQGASAVYPKHPRIYWCQAGNHLIRRAELDGSNPVTVKDTGIDTEPTVLAIDSANKMIYYALQLGTPKTISRIDFDGTNKVDLITSGLDTPMGIALDTVNGTIYWTDQGTTKLYKAPLTVTGGDAATYALATVVGVNPAGIAVDPASTTIYWAEYGGGRIMKADLNGSSASVVNNTNVHQPWALSIDAGRGWLYVTDYYNSGANPMVARLQTSGSWGAALIYYNLSTPSGVAIDVVNENVYWTDATTGYVYGPAASTTTQGYGNLFPRIDTGAQIPIGIAVY